jgi:tetratricopeptide (TPR) repeat protein
MVNKKLIIINILIIFIITSFILNSHAATNKSDKEELIYTINQYIKKAEVLDRNDKKRVEYFERAAELSRDLINNHPDSDIGYAYLAYSLGSITRDVPFYKKISVAKEIKKSIDKSLSLNNKNHLAWFVAGMYYRESSKINGLQRKLAEKYLSDIMEGASFEKAIECFQKAISLNKDSIQYRYELAKTFQDIGNKEIALQEYKRVLAIQANEKKDIIYQNKAKKQLKKIS